MRPGHAVLKVFAECTAIIDYIHYAPQRSQHGQDKFKVSHFYGRPDEAYNYTK
jgi:hypothetical protein